MLRFSDMTRLPYLRLPAIAAKDDDQSPPFHLTAFHARPGNDGTEAATARRKPLLNPRAIIATVVF